MAEKTKDGHHIKYGFHIKDIPSIQLCLDNIFIHLTSFCAHANSANSFSKTPICVHKTNFYT